MSSEVAQALAQAKAMHGQKRAEQRVAVARQVRLGLPDWRGAAVLRMSTKKFREVREELGLAPNPGEGRSL